MFEGILKRIGYYKVNMDNEDLIDYLCDNNLALIYGHDFEKLIVINDAEDNKTDVFIDYVKKTDTQKFYVRKGKKNVLVLEI